MLQGGLGVAQKRSRPRCLGYLEGSGRFPRPLMRRPSTGGLWSPHSAVSVPDVHQASVRQTGNDNGDTRSRAVWKKTQDSLTCSGLAEISVTPFHWDTARTKRMFLVDIPRKEAQIFDLRGFGVIPTATTGDLRVNRDRSNGSVGKKGSKQA